MKRERGSQAALPAWLGSIPDDYLSLNRAFLSDLIHGQIDISEVPILGLHAPMMLNVAKALFDAATTQAEQLPYPGPWTLYVYHLAHNDKEPGPWDDDEGPRATEPVPTWLDQTLKDADRAANVAANRKDGIQLLAAMGFTRAEARKCSMQFSRARAAGWVAVGLARRALPPAAALDWIDRYLSVILAIDLDLWGGKYPWPVPPIDPTVMFEARQTVAQANGTLAGTGRA